MGHLRHFLGPRFVILIDFSTYWLGPTPFQRHYRMSAPSATSQITKMGNIFSFVFCIYSGIINAYGDSSNVLERKLMYCLNRLGYDIEIKVKPSAEPVGHLLLAVA